MSDHPPKTTMERCGQPAKFRYTWPGQPEEAACEKHAQGLGRIAHAMGFPLQLLLVEDGDTRTCQHGLSG